MISKAWVAKTCKAFKSRHHIVKSNQSRLRATAVLAVLWGATTIPSLSQTFTTLHSFAGTSASDGASPGYGPLVQGFDGNLYGTTVQGGTTCSFEGSLGCGEVFQITTGGSISSIYKFCAAGNCLDGNLPEGGLALNKDGKFYGMTDLGGSSGEGTVFKITSGGVLATLDSLSSTTGAFPLTTLMRASNGLFYGITNSGGSSGYGAIFKLTTAGMETVLVNLTNTTGIAQGDTGLLVQGTDGNFYGVGGTGGSAGAGTVFQMKPSGAIKVLHNFSGTPDGNEPTGRLAQGTDGNFYGTTRQGGAYSKGTVFKVTPSGTLTIIYNFCAVNGCPDGSDPMGGLILGTDGNFYGTTLAGGSGGAPGTIYQITPGGTLTTLHSFHGLSDGSEPFASLMQHTNGTFYGTTNAGGTNSLGTVFSLSMGLSPFLDLITTTGTVGSSVTILGTGLTGTSKVSFGAVSAAFAVVSDNEITATVPTGATTGSVTANTPGGAVASNTTFLVQPQITSFSPASGPVGTVVTIKGVSLTQTSKIKFNGKSATFSVNSDTQVTATVPVGATTGKINITTPGGSVSSATSFTVTP